ncbi:hypothetical protein Ataiwa_12400 [Algoriphagus taiwanensis]|uniref:Uncharacterized protein n=1 Tax=Algoriphagus taiwanensis TaxID=1445656 RepID=A0ABQ6PYG3_9BACT|nr:hypothetical protein Ataiwa_12400 [Algoriphagus taiwanensis]
MKFSMLKTCIALVFGQNVAKRPVSILANWV